jgi:hypothetical protein
MLIDLSADSSLPLFDRRAVLEIVSAPAVEKCGKAVADAR